jgi:hypothetical protein
MSDSPLRETRTAFFGGRGAKAQSGQGGAESRTFGVEGHPVCTSDALGARKIGEEPHRTPEGILDAAGDSPPARKARAGFTRAFAVLVVDPIGML